MLILCYMLSTGDSSELSGVEFQFREVSFFTV